MAYNPGFAGLIARKYQIQQQQADSAEQLANANAGYLGAETSAYPAEAAARAFATRAGGAASNAQANLTNTNAGLAPWLAGSEVGERNAAADESTARAGLTRYQTAFNPDITYAGNVREFGQETADRIAAQHGGGYGSGVTGVTDLSGSGALPSASPTASPGTPPPNAPTVSGIVTRGGEGEQSYSYGPKGQMNEAAPYGGQVGGSTGRTSIYSGPGNNVIGGAPVRTPAYSDGTSKVPGKGSGKVDTQPAMLAPGEAVLNRGAAEHLGRDTISLLNAIGARRMGLTVGDASDTSQPNKGSNAGVDNQTGAPDSGPHYAGGTPDVRGAYPYGTPQHPMDESSATPQTSWPRTPADDPFDQGLTPHYAWGTPDVATPPGPGQTTSTGTWAPPPTPNADIRNSVGRPGVPRVVNKPQAMNDTPGYAKGTSKVPGKSSAGKGKGGGKMSPHAAAHTPDGSGLSPGIMEALLSMGGMGGGAAGAPGGAMPGAGGPPVPPTGPVGGIPPAGSNMAPVSLPPMKKKAA